MYIVVFFALVQPVRLDIKLAQRSERIKSVDLHPVKPCKRDL
ncbi:hypothetical protein HanPSC8_Chr01g0023861 [Helianthus annuus]|nr:hypothetical protein HanPSC8_Chr01g0023861 [Helianthus annuus]